VVIRRLVRGETGPTGGPALTDVLGVCTAWGAGSMTIAPADRAPVEVALADIVSGKPVPPRPSHLTRVSARDAELRGLAMVPTMETAELGAWILRTDPAPVGRLLKRANSCLALGSPGVPIEDAAERVLGFYRDRDRPAMAQVEQGSEVEAALRVAGWQPLGRGDASFQAAPMSRLHRLLAPRPFDRLRTAPAGGTSSPARGTSAEPVEAPIRLRIEGFAALAELHDEHGSRIATGAAVLDDDWLGLHGLATDAAHRRRGLARAVLAELVEWGAEHGARTAWLHVETDNGPALALYERLGFSEHHAMRYLVPGSAGADPDDAGRASAATPGTRH